MTGRDKKALHNGDILESEWSVLRVRVNLVKPKWRSETSDPFGDQNKNCRLADWLVGVRVVIVLPWGLFVCLLAWR